MFSLVLDIPANFLSLITSNEAKKPPKPSIEKKEGFFIPAYFKKIKRLDLIIYWC